MSACVVVGPELGGLDSEWQTLSMSYVAAALSAPGQVKQTYPPWLYWLSQYIHPGIRSMWRYRRRAGELLAPVLGTRRAAVERELKEGRRKTGGPREYEDCVQWLLDAHSSYGKTLTPDQLVQDLFVIMTASIHTTSGTALCILFDLIDHPEAVDEIREEIVRVQAAHPVWTRQALGELRVLDSFMRESSRMHALTQYTAVQRVITTGPWVFKDGLVIPTDHEVAFPSYHHNMDPDMHPDAGKFDAHRHLRKRTGPDVHKFHFASVGEDLIGFGAGRHACPGRFFAQETIKLMFVHLLMGYDFQHTDEGLKGPLYLPNNLFIVPNPALPVLVKARAREVTVV
ncbi:cytochrome P450 [Canariomyces notabilis]|uniref:Cytochrome P450 n=1 Tax=Canariomyces notabilis TaxID=2074819 RepID=A0AAN6QBT4_9PEZI|nr:cytochrome P450 [Canariomyces arenarius]